MGDIIRGKLNGKHVVAILLSTILLLSASQFGAIAQQDPVPPSKQKEEKRREKVEVDFYEKLKIMSADEKKRQKTEGSLYKPKEHVVILWVEDPESMEENPDNFAHVNEIKDKVKTVLLKDHKASMVYKGLSLPFVSTKLPVTEILNLADYYYIDFIGDGETDAEPSGVLDRDFGLVKSRADKLIPVETHLDNARGTVNAASLPNCPDGSTCDGSGITVAVIDTGIRQNHPALASKIVGQATCGNGTCTSAAPSFDNHGTANAGIIAADSSAGDYRGIAPAATLLNIQSGLSGYVAAIDWAVANGAKVINLSVKAGDCVAGNSYTTTSLELAVDNAVENGVVVVAGMGNGGVVSGAQRNVNRFACAFNAIGVGAIDDQNTPSKTDDKMWYRSNFGPTFDGRTKPDLVAPGTLIKTATACPIQAGSEYSDKDYWNNNLNPPSCQTTAVGDLNGTSHAAPFVAGAAALLLEKNPTWTPAQVKAAIKKAANNALVNFPNIQTASVSVRGAGVLDVAGALSITSLSDSDMAAWAYGLDVSTYIVKSTNTTNPNTVEYKLVKESNLAYGISAITGKIRESRSSSSPQHPIFAKLSAPSIKINGATKTLLDSKLWAGPRVAIKGNEATTYVTYNIDGKRVQLFFKMKSNLAMLQVKFFNPVIGNTYEIVQYGDYDVDDTNDRARASAGGSPYATEQQLTNAQFYIRDTASSSPFLEYQPISSPTEYILKWHDRTDNPAQYKNGESINPANIVIDYKKSKVNNNAVTLILGPKVKIIWPVVQAEEAGIGEIWIIKDAIPDDPLDFSFTSSALGNFILDDDDDLPTPSPTLDTQLFAQLNPGTYSITETAVSGWDIINVVCTPSGTTTYTRQGNTITITLTGDGGIECIFENIPIE